MKERGRDLLLLLFSVGLALAPVVLAESRFRWYRYGYEYDFEVLLTHWCLTQRKKQDEEAEQGTRRLIGWVYAFGKNE